VQGNESVLEEIYGSWEDMKGEFEALWNFLTEGFKACIKGIGAFFEAQFDFIMDGINKILGLFGKVKNSTAFKLVIEEGPKSDSNNRIKKLSDITAITPSISTPISQEANLIQARQRVLPSISTPISQEANLIQARQRVLPSVYVNPIATPKSTGITSGSSLNKNVTNKITQNITEKVTVNVPIGTTQEQAKVISTQIANEIQEQFNYNMLKGMDSLNNG
jgi:hypothetical protein